MAKNNYGRNAIFLCFLLALVLLDQIVVSDRVSSAPLSVVFKSTEALEYVLWISLVYFLLRHWQSCLEEMKKMEKSANVALFDLPLFKKFLLSEVLKREPSFNANSIDRVAGNMKLTSFVLLLRLEHCGGNGNGLNYPLNLSVMALSKFWWCCILNRFCNFWKAVVQDDEIFNAYAPFLFSMAVFIVWWVIFIFDGSLSNRMLNFWYVLK